MIGRRFLGECRFLLQPKNLQPKNLLMPKTRTQKQEIVSELADKVRRMKSVVFTSISGYTMEDADALRAKGRKEKVEAVVAKKTLLLRAFKDAGIDVPEELFDGSILTTFGFEDEVAPAKIMATFGKDRELIKIIGGILEGKIVDAKSIKTLAKLPSKKELYGKLIGSINSPLSGLVQVLAGNLRGLVNVLNAMKEKKAIA